MNRRGWTWIQMAGRTWTAQITESEAEPRMTPTELRGWFERKIRDEEMIAAPEQWNQEVCKKDAAQLDIGGLSP